MKILVTGAGGFVGAHLIKRLGHDPHNEIFAAVYKATSDLSGLLPADHVMAGDLTDFSYAESMVKSVMPDVVYHLAALSVVHNSVAEARKVLVGNTILQYNLLESLRLHAQSARILAVCSANEYGLVAKENIPINESCPLRPLNPYAVSKVTQEMLAEQYHLAYGMHIVIVRPFNHTGPGQTTDFVIPALAKQCIAIEKGEQNKITVGNLETIRDFTDVEDMVAAYTLAIEKCAIGQVYNIGSGKGVSVAEIIAIFRKQLGIEFALDQTENAMRAADVPILIADAAKFRAATGWSPTIPLEDTIIKVLDYWRRR